MGIVLLKALAMGMEKGKRQDKGKRPTEPSIKSTTTKALKKTKLTKNGERNRRNTQTASVDVPNIPEEGNIATQFSEAPPTTSGAHATEGVQE
ncbi:hypothetical protein SESBI_20167 [Sesbania bispinosa]|nr:hypothetical protein SESBI_20167 [Sesbania bispinosa]